ncbi:PEP-utilizing enzyme, partial [Arthrobacter sp. SW1]|uniref:PEP-utilizing enzyme n=1 Tax=Arthrobacter sp. SW1 TaxID=1920889 RepID=UPI000A606123
MQTFSGVGVAPGRVLGPVRQMPKPVQEPHANVNIPADVTVESQAQRVKDAAKAVQAELRSRAAIATGEGKEVLEATALMAADPMLIKSAVKLLSPEAPGGARTAERAVWEAAATVAETLKSLGGYMAERVADVLDVRARIVAELRGLPAPGIPSSEVPFILAAEDLAPADTATLDPAKVIALITSGGGPQSHTAILARALGLPAVVAAPGVDEISDGVEVYVDGAAGTITTEPSEELRIAAKAWATQASTLAAFTG